MPERASGEFWATLKPIANVFKPDAMPESYLANAPTEDERYYVPISDTVSSRPLWISPQRNQWCDILMAKGAGLVNRHYHPHEVFAYTISGSGDTSSTTGPPLRVTLSTRRPAKDTSRRSCRTASASCSTART